MRPFDILPDEDYRLKMRFEQRPVADFYRPGAAHREVIAERRRWLSIHPEIHTALEPEGVPLLAETIRMAARLNTLPASSAIEDLDNASPSEMCRWLGERWEPDFLLLKPDAQGTFRLRGGGLCFPSHWDLSEKMGRTMAEIHGPVPDLNAQLGRQIDGFLRRMKPGISWQRLNWGLSRTPELNLHPARNLPALDPTVGLDDVWWRIEDQSLVALPESGGILFGIRLVLKSYRDVRADPALRQGMIRALRTMPEPMAAYKGLTSSRQRLIDLLAD